MQITVGRTALYQQFGITKVRKPTDRDVWGDTPQGNSAGIDYCQMSTEIMGLFSDESQQFGIAMPEDLLAIKLSHLPYDIFWWKHAQDVLFLQYKYGYSPNTPLYNALKEHWKQEFGNKDYLSLYKTRDKFFDDFVPKQYEHDYLHTLIAQGNGFGGFPIYEKCLKEGQDVAIDYDKFCLLPFEERVRMFKEEIAVIALERWAIPSVGTIPLCHAWNRALHKTVTRLTKSWASEFLVMNLGRFTSPLFAEMQNTLHILNIKEK